MDFVLELAASRLGWTPEQLTLDYQDSGLTNRNYVVSNGTKKAVIRVNGGGHHDALGINRHAELAAMEAIRGLGTAPEVLYFDADTGTMITRFIEGRTWSAEDLEPNLNRITTLMKKVHGAPAIAFEFSPYADIKRWIVAAQNRGHALPETQDRLLARLHDIEAARAAVADAFRGLCHNDPFANNFMDDGTLRLLDWEFAGMGDVMYDLACIAQSMKPDKQAELLVAYFGDNSPELTQALRDMDYVVSFWNAMWAVTMLDAAPAGGFDYAGLARYLFQKLESALEH